jgi:hypothetical protein
MHEQSSISPQAAVIPGAGKEPPPVYESAQEININDFFLRMPLQRKLAVGATDDPLEQEADEMADRVMCMPEMPFIQKKCGHCKEEERLHRKPLTSFIQRKGGESSYVSPALSARITSLQGAGSSLTGDTKNFMESRFGTDFSSVHIHAGAESVQLSRELNAKAFTVGSDIYFNDGYYSPATSAGKHLLAHELTHVTQQNAGIYNKSLILRDELVGDYSIGTIHFQNPYATDYALDTTGDKDSIGGYNYWFRKIASVYEFLPYEVTVTPPQQLERDAWNVILSKAWELRPAVTPSAANKAAMTQSVLLPVVLGAVKTPPGKSYRVNCLYSFFYDAASGKPAFKLVVGDFTPEPARVIDIDKAPRVIGKKVPDSTTDLLLAAKAVGFPGNDLKQYLAGHPEVKDVLAGYIEWKSREIKKNQANGDRSEQQLIKAKETAGGVENPVLLMLTMRSNGIEGVYSVALTYSSEKNNVVSPGYNDKDYADFEAEADQLKHPDSPDKLGTINGLEKISDVNERRIIKSVALSVYASESTDKAGVKTRSFRDTEVDQVIPITTDGKDPAKTESYYYTFIVHKAIAGVVNIDVKRIGKKGDAVVGNPSLPLIDRIPGFAENAFDANNAETPAKLIKWLLARYKAMKEADIKAGTVKEIADKANAIIAAGATKPDWFDKNYQITILNTKAATARLGGVLHLKAAELAGIKEFSADELNALELSLQRMTLPLLKHLQHVAFARQEKILIPAFTGDSGFTQTSGYQYNKATNNIIVPFSITITLYDNSFTKKDDFFGGTEGVNPRDTGSATHETGHAIGDFIIGGKHKNPTIQSEFNIFYKGLGLVPVTAYSRDTSNATVHSPESEYFPEAFMIFENDPEWLLSNQHQSYCWFLLLQQTGNAPATAKVMSLIAVWEQQKAAQPDSGVRTAMIIYSLWNAFTAQTGKVPDAVNTATLVTIFSAFQSEKNRMMRTDETAPVVKKWLTLVKKQKRQPTADEIKTFFDL